MQRIRPDVDIIKDILDTVIAAQPASTFAVSLLHQYVERGSLSKKQLQGLYGKAVKTGQVNPGKLATLEAIILKKPTRYRSNPAGIVEAKPSDDNTGPILDAILGKYPAHKRVLFLKSKYDHREVMSPAEISEIARFEKLLGSKGV